MEETIIQRHVEIIGRVTPHGRESIKISTEKDSYMVELDYVGKELLEFIDMDIKVTGFVTKYKGGIKQIEIDDYKIADEN